MKIENPALTMKALVREFRTVRIQKREREVRRFDRILRDGKHPKTFKL